MEKDLHKKIKVVLRLSNQIVKTRHRTRELCVARDFNGEVECEH